MGSHSVSPCRCYMLVSCVQLCCSECCVLWKSTRMCRIMGLVFVCASIPSIRVCHTCRDGGFKYVHTLIFLFFAEVMTVCNIYMLVSGQNW